MILLFCRYAVDLVVCVALGCDMFDCVFPTRTAVSSCAVCTRLRSFGGYKSTSRIHLECVPDRHASFFPSEVWLCLGALGISAGET